MSNIEETKMTDEAFNELIDNFEVVGHLTEYGRKAIKQKIKEMQAKIKELEAKLEFKKYGDLDEIEFEEYMSHFIPKQKVKDYLKEEQERFEVYKKECETNENLKFGMWKHLGAKNMCEKILGIEKNIATLD